jgi:hypothetical protein
MKTASVDANDLAWFSKATVRLSCTDVLGEEKGFDWRFPVEMKPLLQHEAVLAQSLEARRFIHVQAFHKYLHDVCLTETEVVNQVAADMAYGRSVRPFPVLVAADALAIIVDEAFHSYMARLFSMKVSRATGIAPLCLPQRNALVNAYEDVAKGLNEGDATLSRFLCCCLSESTFTKEILAASRLRGYDPGFRVLMEHHLADEGRHYGYFRSALAWLWTGLGEDERETVATLLPLIISKYFDDAEDRSHDHAVLLAAGMAPSTVVAVLDDIERERPPLRDSPRLRNSLEFLRLANVLPHPAVRRRLADEGLIA